MQVKKYVSLTVNGKKYDRSFKDNRDTGRTRLVGNTESTDVQLWYTSSPKTYILAFQNASPPLIFQLHY